jgi:ABC-type amino acid transport substrate-binding protein
VLPSSSSLLSILSVFSPSLTGPWDELDPAGRSSDDFAVRLGQVTWDGTSFSAVSMRHRAGVIPRFSGLRNSFGHISVLLGRDASDKASMGVVVPTTFNATAPATFQAPADFQTALTVRGTATFQQPVSFQGTAGGPLAQAAVVAKDVGFAPAGRVNAIDPRVFEAAGGRGGAPAGVSGVLAVSMEYDDVAGDGFHAFEAVPHAGFPLELSDDPLLTAGPKLVPAAGSSSRFIVGISAGTSDAVSSSVAIVPVATAGVVRAFVTNLAGAPLPAGT